ncbi:Uncharacterised protein [uncultured archaeon]|nr:Uncharacterised protein [uncultured archaeon]
MLIHQKGDVMKKAILLILLLLCPSVLGTYNIIEQWDTTLFTGTASSRASGVAVDSSDNVAVAGRHYNGVDLDWVVVKYDSSGSQLWNHTIAGSSSEDAEDVVVDGGDNIIAGGQNGSKWLIIKYNSAGTQVCNTTFASRTVFGIDKDSSNNIIAAGTTTTGTSESPTVAKFDSSCNYLWNATYPAIGIFDLDAFQDVAVDSLNNVVAAGNINGGKNLLVVKYDSSGNYQWNRTIPTGTYGYTRWPGYGVDTDSSNNVIVTGTLNDTAWPPTTHTAVFIIKYDSNGNQLWNKTINATTYLAATENKAGSYDVAVDSSNEILIGGFVYANSYPSRWYLKFNSAGTYMWNKYVDVVANSTSFDVASLNTTAFASTGIYFSWITEEYDQTEEAAPAPEFSTITLLMAALIGAGIIFAVRKHK